MNIRYKVNSNFFKEWSEEMAYIFGYWYADGNMNRCSGGYRFSITSNDLEHLLKIRKLLSSNHKLRDRKDDNSYTLRISNKEIYNDILKLGGVPAKSLIAKFPCVPKLFIKHFIRGYFDGDGSIYLRNGEPHINIVGTKPFLSTLENHLPYKGRLNKVSKQTYQLSYNGEYAQDVLDFIYLGSSLNLSRKYNLYQQAIKWNRRRKLRNDSMLLKMNGYPKSYDYRNI